MGRPNRDLKIYACDFETTTDNPNKVEVWSFEAIEIKPCVASTPENTIHFSDLESGLFYFLNVDPYCDIRLYFHNLKFDGSYIMDYLAKSDKFQLFSYTENNKIKLVDQKPGIKRKQIAAMMRNGNYSYMMSDKNVLYSIRIMWNNRIIEIRDSMKLLPFSLSKIAHDFGTEHKKLEMDYGHKLPGYVPTSAEMEYIQNDVFVLKEAIEIFSKISNREISKLPLTIGSLAMSEFKELTDPGNGYMGYNFKRLFPSQMDYIPGYDGVTFDNYIRRSYHGGWCYVSPRFARKVMHTSGYVYDVNSLYPSVMHSLSGCFYPYGKGYIHAGDLKPNEIKAYKQKRLYYFIHIKTSFQIKKDHLPTIQIKGSNFYNPVEWLTSSDIINRRTGERIPNRVELVLTCTDWELLQDHYELQNLEIIDHVDYRGISGIFDNYINKWYEIKKHSKGAMRSLAKLLLNNLYGKFSTAPIGDYLVFSVEKNKLVSDIVEQDDFSRAVYIPIGSAVTSWARNFTIRHAQANYSHFVYADTDSLHMIGDKKEAKNIKEDPVDLCCWKNETNWDMAVFYGPKRYIEHVVAEDCTPCEPHNNIKCCGMGKEAKDTLDEFLTCGRYDYSVFCPGLIAGGNIKGHRVEGGIFLEEKAFTFRDNYFFA